jgi:hypothetical protein
MRLLPYICALLFSAGLFGQDRSTPLDQLLRDVDAAAPTVAPQQIFDTPEANRLGDFIRFDVRSNQAKETIEFLRLHQDTKPSWQVIVEAVWSSYASSAPTSKDAPSLESLFTATIKDGDHWLNYSSPRGWTNPYSFRTKLAKLILHARTGTSQDIEDQAILRDDPSRWLSQLTPTSTMHAAQTAVSMASTVSVPPLQPLATAQAPEAKPAPTPTEEPASSTPWRIIVVMIVAAVGLLWLLLKRRS